MSNLLESFWTPPPQSPIFLQYILFLKSTPNSKIGNLLWMASWGLSKSSESCQCLFILKIWFHKS